MEGWAGLGWAERERERERERAPVDDRKYVLYSTYFHPKYVVVCTLLRTYLTLLYLTRWLATEET